MRRWRLKLLAVGLSVAAALGVAVYFRPVASFSVIQRILLRLSGVHSRFVTVNGFRVHYLDGGSGSPVLLLHGHRGRALEWAPLLRPLLDGHRVLALDFLGYGDSEAPDIDYAVSTQAAMVNAFLDAQHLSQVDLLGFSMGGWVALTVARDHPERVRRLVLVGSGGLRFPSTLTAAGWVPRSLAEFRATEQVLSDRRTPTFLARDLVRTSLPRAWAHLRSGAALLSFREALDGQLGTIRTPTLLVWGEAERVIPLATGQRMAHELPSARLITVPGCGHFLLWECTDRTWPPVVAFLR